MKNRYATPLIFPVFVAFAGIAFLTGLFLGEDGRSLLTVDHYVKVRSTVPAMSGQTAQLYVRERVEAGTVLRAVNLDDRVVLFVHGAGTPAEVAFDVPTEDYSWMGYLARSGFEPAATGALS